MATEVNPRARPLIDVILHFTPAWFTAIMGTGSISLLIHAFPYGSGSKIFDIWALMFFGLNLSLFILFCVMTATRYIMFPRIWGIMVRHPAQSVLIGSFPMGGTTLLRVATSLISGKYHLGGKRLLYALWCCWWLDVATSIVCCWGILFIMQATHKHSLENMTAVWLLPVVTLIAASSTGGVFAQVLDNPSHALFTQTASLFIVFIGLSLALMIMTVYFQRLILVGVPPGADVISAFFPLGPTSSAAYSLLLAGRFFRDNLPLQYGDSVFLTDPSSGKTIYAVCVCISFALWALGSMWMLFALLAVQSEFRRARIPFKVNAWGMIFPNAVYANITINLGITFSSPFFRMWGSIYAVCTLVLWIFVFLKTIQLVYKRTIFESPCVQELDLGSDGISSSFEPSQKKNNHQVFVNTVRLSTDL